MPKWNTYLANVNTFYQNNLFLENGNYITELVDSYYIVGEGVDTINSLQFNVDLNDEFTSLTVNTTNEGDNTVTIQSATVGNTLSADRVYYKLNSGSFESGHVEMARGKDDTTTIEFVCDIIDLSPTQMQYPENHENWYDWFGVYREGEIEENI